MNEEGANTKNLLPLVEVFVEKSFLPIGGEDDLEERLGSESEDGAEDMVHIVFVVGKGGKALLPEPEN